MMTLDWLHVVTYRSAWKHVLCDVLKGTVGEVARQPDFDNAPLNGWTTEGLHVIDSNNVPSEMVGFWLPDISRTNQLADSQLVESHMPLVKESLLVRELTVRELGFRTKL